MDILQILTQSIVVLIGLFLYFLFKSYWPKYFETKGTYRATKEEIGKITEIVEEIKTDLANKTEELKAQLSFSTQHKLNLKSAEREALFDYNKKVSAWLYSLVRFDMTRYNIDNYKELDKVAIEFSRRQYECDLAQAHLLLFLHDQDYRELNRDFTISIIKYEHLLANAILEFKSIYSMTEINLGAKPIDKQITIMQEMYEKAKVTYAKYKDDTMEQYKVTHQFHTTMIELINTKLKAITED